MIDILEDKMEEQIARLETLFKMTRTEAIAYLREGAEQKLKEVQEDLRWLEEDAIETHDKNLARSR